MKTCSKCGIEKSRAEFHADKRRRDGRRAYCKACRAEYDRQQHAANPDAVRERCRRWRETNRDAERERVRTHRAQLAARTEAEIIDDRTRLRPDNLKRCRKCQLWFDFGAYSADRSSADGLNAACRACDGNSLIRRAAPYWADLDLTGCAYCGIPFYFVHDDVVHDLGHLEVEHMVPTSKHGTDDAGNLIPACTDCNRGPGGKFTTNLTDWLLTLPANHPASLHPRVAAMLSEAVEDYLTGVPLGL